MTQPRLARQSRGRRYNWPPLPDPETGEYELDLPSITTILGAGLPKPALRYWGQKVVAEYAYDNRDKWHLLDRDDAVKMLKDAPWKQSSGKAEVGTNVHEAMECLSLDKPVPDTLTPLEREYVAGGWQFLQDWAPEFLFVEATVFTPSLGYAGTTDGFAIMGTPSDPDTKVPVIFDYKTSKAIYPDVALQLMAGAAGEFIGTIEGDKHDVPEVTKGIAVRLAPNAYELVEFDLTGPVLESFKAVIGVANWARDVSKVVQAASFDGVFTPSTAEAARQASTAHRLGRQAS